MKLLLKTTLIFIIVVFCAVHSSAIDSTPKPTKDMSTLIHGSWFEPTYLKPVVFDTDFFDNGTFDFRKAIEYVNISYFNNQDNSVKYSIVPLAYFKNELYEGVVCLSGIAGNNDDIWVVLKEGNQWSKPFFTDTQIFSGSDPILKDEWRVLNSVKIDSISATVIDKTLDIEISFFLEPIRAKSQNHNFKNAQANFLINVDFSEILKDTDSDGLTDLIENGFGTIITKSDTDKDGIPDGNDTNPQTPIRPKSDFVEMCNLIIHRNYENGTESNIYVIQYEWDHPMSPDNKCVVYDYPHLVLRKLKKMKSNINLITFHEPKYSNDGTVSIEVGFRCGAICGHGVKYIFKNLNNKWTVVDVEDLWES